MLFVAAQLTSSSMYIWAGGEQEAADGRSRRDVDVRVSGFGKAVIRGNGGLVRMATREECVRAKGGRPIGASSARSFVNGIVNLPADGVVNNTLVAMEAQS